ncbi:MAG: DUF3854 domain-containing protein, partial [Mycobacterium sp.]|nr:DUF3854 domain-containing protein [Mycobacterium sp.]
MIAPVHLADLAASGISPEYAALRGYETIEDHARLQRLNIPVNQQRVPGLLVPGHRKDGSLAGVQYRPDNPPPAGVKDIKYISPLRQRNYVDVPVGYGGLLDDATVPLWVTEGAKKADCAAIHGLCCVSINGVWGWRGGTGTKGTTAALGDWESIVLDGRLVILAFDGDVARKKSVRDALARLAEFLVSRGAKVQYLHLPDTDDKTGLDDYLASHTVEQLWELVRPEIPGGAAEMKWPKAQKGSTGSLFIGRDGLLVKDLAEAVIGSVACGFNENEKSFYTYRDGVWIEGSMPIEDRIVTLLGNKYRAAHTRSVLDVI